jgi:hypothetical protein
VPNDTPRLMLISWETNLNEGHGFSRAVNGLRLTALAAEARFCGRSEATAIRYGIGCEKCGLVASQPLSECSVLGVDA